jgi:hypothetical protein
MNKPGIYDSLKATGTALERAAVKYSYVEYLASPTNDRIWHKQFNDFAPLLSQSRQLRL